jgi:hypothetical protein
VIRKQPKADRVLDIEDVFLNHREVAAALRSGETIIIEDDKGRAFARVEPVPEIIRRKPRKESKAAGLKTS